MKFNSEVRLFNLLLVALFLYSYSPYLITPAFSQPNKNLAATTDNHLPIAAFWFSWATTEPTFILRNLCETPQGIDRILVAFALEKSNLKGITLELAREESFKNDVLKLQKKGIKVFLSTGGANGAYPWLVSSLDDQAIADQYVEFLKNYHFEGIDFDVEKGSLERIPNIIALIKQDLPNLRISLSLPLKTNGIDNSYNNLAKNLFIKNHLDDIYLMNYNGDYYVSTCSFETMNLKDNCYINNLETTRKQIQAWTKDESIAKKLLGNGIMIGYADDKKVVKPKLAAAITAWLKENNYGSVMLWGLNRDQASCSEGANIDATTGIANIPIGAFTNAVINQNQSTS